MNKIYKSKIDSLFIFLTAAPLASSMIFMIFKNQFLGVIILILVSVFISSLFLKTFYEINGYKLIVRSTLLLKIEVDIKSIKCISKSNSWEKAPALSMDRLEIKYGNYI